MGWEMTLSAVLCCTGANWSASQTLHWQDPMISPPLKICLCIPEREQKNQLAYAVLTFQGEQVGLLRAGGFRNTRGLHCHIPTPSQAQTDLNLTRNSQIEVGFHGQRMLTHTPQGTHQTGCLRGSIQGAVVCCISLPSSTVVFEQQFPCCYPPGLNTL